MATNENLEAIVGPIQQDLSGVGHCWRVDMDIPADIREEIAAEILDGGQEHCSDYVASNGLHYRWGV